MATQAGDDVARSGRIRKQFVMKVKEGAVDEYVRAHDNIWPDMSSMLKEHGVHNYSIALLPSTHQLVAYVEIESEARWDAIATTEMCQRWWKFMAPLMETDDAGRPKAEAAREVFFLK
jgi:L-rhamnose mutarotase